MIPTDTLISLVIFCRLFVAGESFLLSSMKDGMWIMCPNLRRIEFAVKGISLLLNGWNITRNCSFVWQVVKWQNLSWFLQLPCLMVPSWLLLTYGWEFRICDFCCFFNHLYVNYHDTRTHCGHYLWTIWSKSFKSKMFKLSGICCF